MTQSPDSKQSTEKRIKNTGTTTAYGDNGGSRQTTKQYRNNFDQIDWSKK